jgi:AdoMet-dependent heme synthase
MIVLSQPALYALELTAACNNHCAGCSNVFLRDCLPLSAADWCRVLASLTPHVRLLKLTGGEPTLHPEFAKIIRAIEETGTPFSLFTDARWRDPQATIDLLRTVSQCSGLLISLHGPDAVSHDAFTCTPSSFEEACENIRRATAAGLRVHTSTVLTCHNYDRVREVAALAFSLGAQRAVFNRYIGFPMPDLEPEPWQLRQAMHDIERMRQYGANGQGSAFSVKYGNCIPQCFAPSSSTGCWAGVAYCTIDPWGNLRPCNHSPTIAGNILEEPIEAIWHNDIMNRWRARQWGGCETCAELETCHGGCRAMAEIRHADRDPLTGHPIQEEHSRRLTELELYENSRPKLSCTVQPEPFGYALIRGHAILPVTAEARPILDVLDGTMTLRELSEGFGQEALDLM